MKETQCVYCKEVFPLKGEQAVALEIKNEHDMSHYGCNWVLFHPRCHSDIIFELDESIKDEIRSMTIALNSRTSEAILKKLCERRKLLEN